VTKEDIEDAAEAAIKKVLDARDREFYIHPREHYLHHKFIEELIGWLDKTKGTIWGAVIRTMVYGLLVLIVLGVIVFVGMEVKK
jgi:hypothetical protein